MRSLPELLFGVGNGEFLKILLAVLCSIALGFVFFARRLGVSLNPLRHLQQQQQSQNQDQDQQVEPCRCSFKFRDEAKDLITLFEATFSWIDARGAARLKLPQFLSIATYVYFQWKQGLLELACPRASASTTTSTDDNGTTKTTERRRFLLGGGRAVRALMHVNTTTVVGPPPPQQEQRKGLLFRRGDGDGDDDGRADDPIQVPAYKCRGRGRDRTAAPMRARVVRERAAARAVPCAFPEQDGYEGDVYVEV